MSGPSTGLSLQIHPGETVALLGPNGAGKSTIEAVQAARSQGWL